MHRDTSLGGLITIALNTSTCFEDLNFQGLSEIGQVCHFFTCPQIVKRFTNDTMDTAAVLSQCWSTVRIPVIICVAAVWIFMTWNRDVAPLTEPEVLLKRAEVNIPTPEPLLAGPKAVAQREESVERNTKVKSAKKKPPKKFTRATPAQPTFDLPNDLVPPEIHIFYASQFNHTSQLARHLLTLLSEYTRLHDISAIPNLDD